MNWFRSNIQSGIWLALLALTLQMAVSFGHMHRHDLGLATTDKSRPDANINRRGSGRRANPDDQDHHSGANHLLPDLCEHSPDLDRSTPALAPVLVVPDLDRSRFAVRKPGVISNTHSTTISFSARGPPSV